MTKTQLLTAIKNKLIAQTWTGSTNVVFPSGSVVVSKAIARSALASMTVPVAQIIPGGGKADQQFDEDPNLLVMPVTVRLITLAPGDAVGENPLMGANRADSTLSEGAGLYDLEQELYNAIGKLNVQDGIVIQFRNQGDSGAEYIDDGLYMAYEDHNFEAICTVTASTSTSTSNVQSTKSTGDQTATDGTLVDVAGLSFSVTAGTTYYFLFQCVHQSNTATIGLKLGLTFPAVTTFAATAKTPITAGSVTSEFSGPITASGGSITGTAVPVINTNYLATIEGVIVPSASGTLQVQFAAETTGGTVTFKANSPGLLYTIS